MKKVIPIFLIYLSFFVIGCDQEVEEGVMKSDLSKDVEMVTDHGSIVLRLSDKTPIHRNNFIKLVNQQFYDSIAFHRVIDNFVIQAGNPTTKPSQTYDDNGDPELDYTIEAEITPSLFHKRGALGAARTGYTSNRSRASSGLQFYIVQRGPYVDSTLNRSLKRVNTQLAFNKLINSPEISVNIDKYNDLRERLNEFKEEDKKAADTVLLNSLKSKIDGYKLDSLAEKEAEQMKKYKFPEAHREFYKTIGGAPHLDQNYTIFGEVVHGMSVVDSIAQAKTNDSGKPLDDILIISARMIKRTSY